MFGQYSDNARDRDQQVRSTGMTGRASHKRVFTTAQVAHVWAQQKQDDGRTSNGNVFFRGPTLYSYRENFPTASFVAPGLVLVNLDKYSVTTSSHQSDMRGALRGLDVVTLDVGQDNLTAYLRQYSAENKTAVAAHIVADVLSKIGAEFAEYFRKAKVSTFAEVVAGGFTWISYRCEEVPSRMAALSRFAALHDLPNPLEADPVAQVERLAAEHAAKLAAEKAAEQAQKSREAARVIELYTLPDVARVMALLSSKLDAIETTADAVSSLPFAELLEAKLDNCFPTLSQDETGPALRSNLSLHEWKRTRDTMSKAIHHARGPQFKAGRAALRANVATLDALLERWSHVVEPKTLVPSRLLISVRFYGNVRAGLETGTLAQRAAYAATLGTTGLCETITTAAKFGHVETAARIAETVSARYAAAEIARNHPVRRPTWLVERERAAVLARRDEAATRAAWLAGEDVRFYQDEPTLVRHYRGELQTSRGAVVPFRSAVAIFVKAQQCVARGVSWHRNGETMQAGVFELDAIRPNGNIKIGCHTIEFAEMLRLAVAEVPELVKPRFPVPAVI